MELATIFDVAATAPWSFILGALVGWVVASRYQLSIRKMKNGDDNDGDE